MVSDAMQKVITKRELYCEDYTVLNDTQSSAVAYLGFNKKGYPVAVMYKGRRTKPSSQFYYMSDEKRQESIDAFFESVRQDEDFKKQRAKRSSYHGIKVGDVFSSSWGYEQTNVDFYQVVKLIGKTMVGVREISADCEHGNGDYGYKWPRINDFIDDRVLRRKVTDGDWININSYSGARLRKPHIDATGKAVYEKQYYSWGY